MFSAPGNNADSTGITLRRSDMPTAATSPSPVAPTLLRSSLSSTALSGRNRLRSGKRRSTGPAALRRRANPGRDREGSAAARQRHHHSDRRCQRGASTLSTVQSRSRSRQRWLLGARPVLVNITTTCWRSSDSVQHRSKVCGRAAPHQRTRGAAA